MEENATESSLIDLSEHVLKLPKRLSCLCIQYYLTESTNPKPATSVCVQHIIHRPFVIIFGTMKSTLLKPIYHTKKSQ